MSWAKTILKKIFPTPFLKDAFLVYNKIRIRTIDRIFFPEYPIRESDFTFYRKAYPFRENKVQTAGIADEKVRRYMEQWNDWTQEEFILVIKKQVCIEPVYGWGVVFPSKLIYYSLGISRTWAQRKPDWLALRRRKTQASFPSVISLRDSGEENYFHFYNDVLTKIFFLQEHAIPVTEIPVVISRKLWDSKFFQHYHEKSGLFRSLKWIVQDRQYIISEKTIFCKPLTHRRDLLAEVAAPLRVQQEAKRKIFLTRGRNRMRHLENSEEIEALCREQGFEIVDTDLLSLPAQIELFAHANWIIGLHGAGLVNLLFCPGGHLLEIFPPGMDYLPFHYIMLADMQGMRYQGVIGEKALKRYSGGFYLPVSKFREALKQFVNE